MSFGLKVEKETSTQLNHLTFKMSLSVCLGEDKGKYIQITLSIGHQGTFLVAHLVNNLPANAGDAGDTGLIPGLERSPGDGRSPGNGSPLQYSFLGNPIDRGAWQAAVHEVIK